MTYDQAIERLPNEAVWSCSFGNHGDHTCTEIWRAKDGRGWQIHRPLYGGHDEWTVTEEG